MSLMDTMVGEKIRRSVEISVNEIRTNTDNFYPIVDIEGLAISIQEHGQLENATIYPDDGEDGKKYTLIGGERRYRAVSLSLEQSKGDGILICNIIDKPVNKDSERMLIMADNIQREKDNQTKDIEIKMATLIYEQHKAEGIVPTGMLKRDYVGKLIGMTGRNVYNYISGRIGANKAKTPATERELEIKDVITIVNRVYKQVEKAYKFASQLNNEDYIKKLQQVLDNLDEVKSLED